VNEINSHTLDVSVYFKSQEELHCPITGYRIEKVMDITINSQLLESDYEKWIEVDEKGELTIKDFTVPRNVQVYVQATAGTVWSEEDFSIAKYEIKSLPILKEVKVVELLEQPVFAKKL
jgi:hypothetical protein